MTKIEKRQQQGNLRALKLTEGMIDFCSNDYLGFARSVELNSQIRNIKSEIRNINGSTGSRLLSGNSQFAEDLEQQIANFHKAEAGLIYNSGYDANLGLFSCLPQKEDIVIYDELVHASIRDGIRLSFAKSFSFRHNDLNDLEKKLKIANGEKFVAIESVYSMDGDFSPLKEMVDLCKKYEASLIIDEAHATGIFGKRGEGRVVELGLENCELIIARIHTFGKALGSHGAIVLGSQKLRQYLINFSRSFIYTTALPIHTLKTVKYAYDILSNEYYKIIKTSIIINIFKENIKQYKNFNILPSESPIQSIIIPGNEEVKTLANELQKSGFDVRPILSPTVPKNQERLRICLHNFNTKKEVRDLIEVLKRIRQ